MKSLGENVSLCEKLIVILTYCTSIEDSSSTKLDEKDENFEQLGEGLPPPPSPPQSPPPPQQEVISDFNSLRQELSSSKVLLHFSLNSRSFDEAEKIAVYGTLIPLIHLILVQWNLVSTLISTWLSLFFFL